MGDFSKYFKKFKGVLVHHKLMHNNFFEMSVRSDIYYITTRTNLSYFIKGKEAENASIKSTKLFSYHTFLCVHVLQILTRNLKTKIIILITVSMAICEKLSDLLT